MSETMSPSRGGVVPADAATLDDDQAETTFLSWLLGYQDDSVGEVPATGNPVARLAASARTCVERGHVVGTEQWSAFDFAVHVGAEHPRAMPGGVLADWVRTGMRLAILEHREASCRGVAKEPEATALELATTPEFRARAEAVGCGRNNWPYGPNVRHQARLDLVEWAEREQLRWAPDRRCLHWLTVGRCGVAVCDHHQGAWFDHASGWTRNRKPDRLIVQPYQLAGDDMSRMAALAELYHVRLSVHGPGWYGGPTLFVEFRKVES